MFRVRAASNLDSKVGYTSAVVQRKPLLFNSLSKWPAQAIGRKGVML